MPTTERALKKYLFRALMCFLAGGLVATALLLCFPMKTRLDTILCLILGCTTPGGLYVVAKYIDKKIDERTMQPPVTKLFDVKTYGMLLIISPFVFVLAMGKGLWRLCRLTREERPHA